MANMESLGAQRADWNQYGSGSSGGLGAVLGAYIADKTGLIDLKDQAQQANFQKNGLMSTMIGNQFAPAGSVPPTPTDMTGFQQKSVGGAYPLQMVAPPGQLGSGTFSVPESVNPQASRDTPVSQFGGNNQSTPTGNEWDQYPGSGFSDKLKNFASMFGQ